jgi:hypothetical protein
MRIYTDESCTQADQGKVMLIGGVICDGETAKEVRQAIQSLKDSLGLKRDFEFHFTKMKPSQVEIYQKFCDLFCEFYAQKCDYKRGTKDLRIYRRICFEAILISHAKINHLQFSAGDAELGFFRFYYTLLAHVLKKHYSAERPFHIVIDAISTKNKQAIPNLHQRLNNSAILDIVEPVKILHRQDSQAEFLLQMSDVILGCVSFAWNKLPTQSSKIIDAKREVVYHLENNLGKTLSEPSYSGNSFNIWELQMQ